MLFLGVYRNSGELWKGVLAITSKSKPIKVTTPRALDLSGPPTPTPKTLSTRELEELRVEEKRREIQEMMRENEMNRRKALLFER